MRDVKEIGSFKEFNEKANQAYQTYASIYLDFVDDNTEHFFNRGVFEEPTENIPDHLYEPPYQDSLNEEVYKAYMEAATGIAKTVLSTGYFEKMEDLYQEFPLLREKAEELEALFYEKEER